jgi:hypothetical protein
VGSSYTKFRGRGFWTRDHILVLWYLLLYEQVEALESVPDWLREAAETWRSEACFGGGGITLAQPDEGWSDEQLDVVLDLVEAALAGLEPGGRFAGADLLRRVQRLDSNASPIWWSNDEVPTEQVRQVGDGFLRLLDGTFPPDPPFASAFLGTPRGWTWTGKLDALELDYEWFRNRSEELRSLGGSHWQRYET